MHLSLRSSYVKLILKSNQTKALKVMRSLFFGSMFSWNNMSSNWVPIESRVVTSPPLSSSSTLVLWAVVVKKTHLNDNKSQDLKKLAKVNFIWFIGLWPVSWPKINQKEEDNSLGFLFNLMSDQSVRRAWHFAGICVCAKFSTLININRFFFMIPQSINLWIARGSCASAWWICDGPGKPPGPSTP